MFQIMLKLVDRMVSLIVSYNNNFSEIHKNIYISSNWNTCISLECCHCTELATTNQKAGSSEKTHYLHQVDASSIKWRSRKNTLNSCFVQSSQTTRRKYYNCLRRTKTRVVRFVSLQHNVWEIPFPDFPFPEI